MAPLDAGTFSAGTLEYNHQTGRFVNAVESVDFSRTGASFADTTLSTWEHIINLPPGSWSSDPRIWITARDTLLLKVLCGGPSIDMHESQVAMEFEHHDLISAPVLGEDNRLLGRITIDDVVDVMRDEAEHTVLTMAGLDEEADMFAPVFQSARRRWVWLGVNLVTALLAAMVLYAFEATLDQIVATAVLFPIVMSMGGIAGTQTLTLMIRGMATGQVSARNTPDLLRKELAVGLLNGILFSVLVGTVAFFWYDDILLGLVIGAAILLNLLVGALAGALVPVILKRMSIDPALAGGVVLTTVTDVVGILAFIGLATFILL